MNLFKCFVPKARKGKDIKMNKKFKNVICAALSASVILGTFGMTGCKKQEEAGNINLKWVLLGPGNQKDSKMVQDEFNKKLEEYMPGVTVDFEIITGEDYSEKWNLMMATNEEVDIAWTGYAVDFLQQVQQGSYIELNELLDKYASEMKQDLPDWIFDLTTVNDKIYAIPNYQMMATWPQGVRLLKEYSDKYFDREAIMKKYDEWAENPEAGKEFYQLWADGLEKMKQNNELGNGVAVNQFGKFRNKVRIDTTTVDGFSIDMDTKKVIIDEKSDSTKLWYQTAADWYKKGYIRNDILSVQDFGTDAYKNGYCMWVHTWDETSAERESAEKGVELDCIPLSKTSIIRNAIPSTATVIPRTSKNPEKAMELINLLNTEKGKDLYNLLTWGIEGVHYTKISENRIKPLYDTSQATSEDDYGLWNWAIASVKNSYEPQAQLEGWADYIMKIDEKAEISPVLGFKPDTSKLTTEISQFNAVVKEYGKTLRYGAAQNEEETYNEFINKLDTAGAEKIREELQRQLDEWLANNK